MVCRTVPWTERPPRCRIMVRFELFDPILYGAQTLILVQAVRFPLLSTVPNGAQHPIIYFIKEKFV